MQYPVTPSCHHHGWHCSLLRARLITAVFSVAVYASILSNNPDIRFRSTNLIITSDHVLLWEFLP